MKKIYTLCFLIIAFFANAESEIRNDQPLSNKEEVKVIPENKKKDTYFSYEQHLITNGVISAGLVAYLSAVINSWCPSNRHESVPWFNFKIKPKRELRHGVIGFVVGGLPLSFITYSLDNILIFLFK
jgi:hypothetical protein